MKSLLPIQKRLWAEINLDNALFNFKTIDKPVCCVIKANAYGHGSIQLARLYENAGASYFAVSNIEEAIQLRNAGIKKPILILGFTPVDCVNDLAKYDIEQTVYNSEYANELNERASLAKVKIKIHIKIDSGMGRIGFQFHEGINELPKALASCKYHYLIPHGIFTHFAISDEGINRFTQKQYNYFIEACRYFENNGIHFAVKHCSNSAAIIDYPDYHLDMVRAGISLYGINPTPNKSVKLKQVLSLWSVVSNVKTIRKGDSVSYGRTFIADKDMTVATIPVGYADGFWRSNQGFYVYLNNEYCRIIGRVCMDQIMVECNNAKMGDLVEIYGEHLPIEETAKHNKTIPYEILCSIGERVPRVYKKNGTIIEIIDKLI